MPTTVQNFYATGTVSVTSTGTAVTGFGTVWLNNIRADDVLWIAGVDCRVLSVTDNTHLVLAHPWPGPDATHADYEIRMPPPSADVTVGVRGVVESFLNGVVGTIESLSAANGDVLQYESGWQNTSFAAFVTSISAALAFPTGGPSTPAINFGGTSGLSASTATGPVIASVNGARVAAFVSTGLAIRSSGAAHDLILSTSEVTTADRTLSFVLNDANRTVSLAGNFTVAGAYALTLTQTGSTNVTLPTTGTLSTLAGAEALTNKTINASSNTVSNLTTAMFASGVFDTDTTLSANSDLKIPSQKAVKTYFDNALTGLQWKTAVLCATTANITLSGEQTIDGQLTSASRVLVKNQTSGSENGIYVSAAGAWTRATDMDAGSEFPSATVFVEAGTANGDTQWTCTNNAVTVNTTAVVFAQVSGAGTYSAGQGLTLTSNQFSIANNAITYGLFQQVAASSLVGNPTGSLANAQAITVGAALAFSGTSLRTVAMTGDVTTAANSFATTVAVIGGTSVGGSTGSGNVVFGTAPSIAGGSHTALATLGVRNSGIGAFDGQFAFNGTMTGNRKLTVWLGDADRALDLSGGSLIISGGQTTLTAAGTTNVTLPTTGTLSTLAGAETLTNKTFNAANNTLTNINTTMFAANVADTDTTLAASSDSRFATQHAVKVYIDSQLLGLFWKAAVQCIAVANITLSGEQTIDGVLTSASRVLVVGQTITANNGIYVSAAGAWTRASDAATGAEIAYSTVLVETGTTYHSTVWTCTNQAITLGTTGVTYVQVAASSTSYAAGTNLQLAGSTFSVINNPTFSGTITSTANGALSAPAVIISGTPIQAGGTATTTKPLFLIETSGATSTGWNTSGTMLGINAPSGFSSIAALLSLQVNGVEKHYFGGNGDMVIQGGLTVQGSGGVFGANAGQINSTDGLAIASNKYWAFSSTTGSNGTTDVFVGRKGAANLQFGKADAATAVAQTLSVQSIAAGNNNVAGQNWLNIASLSTGSGTPGDYIIQTGFQGVAQNATVTMTIASPCVVSLTAHGFSAGQPVKFTTTGALPTGITASTVYYVISAGLTANAFEIAATVGGAAINTSGTQSGTHTIDTRGLVGPAVTALTIKGGTQAATFAGAVAVTGALTTATQSAGDNSTKAATTAYVDSALYGANKIINGGMVLDQRNAGASVTPTGGQYCIDRWYANLTVTSKYSVQQKSDGQTGNPNYLRVTSLSAYSVASTDAFRIEQVVEGLNIKDLGFGAAGAKAVTLGFWVRSSLTGQFGGALQNGTAARSYPFSYTINSANTWEYKTIAGIPGDTTGTWATDNTAGLIVNFNLGAGSTKIGAAGSWAASNLVGATGDTSVVGTNAATFDITAIKLEAGSVATKYVEDDFAILVQKCQRYYEKSYSLSVVPGTVTSPGAGCASFMLYSMPSGAYINIHIGAMFAVRKRGVPTVTAYSPQTGTAGKFRDNPNSVDVTANVDTIGETSARMYGGMGTAQTSIDMWAHWVADAEL